jgi:cytochrome c551/c552
MAEAHETQEAGGDRWDPLVKGAATGAAIVLVVFLIIVGIIYFSSDYEFATAAPAPSDEPVAGGGGAPASSLDGMALAAQTGCVACHSTDGSVIVGPSWQGVAGSTRSLDDGSSVVADRSYLVRAIKAPNEQIVEGFNANLMPNSYSDLLSPEEIDAIAAYIETLG